MARLVINGRYRFKNEVYPTLSLPFSFPFSSFAPQNDQQNRLKKDVHYTTYGPGYESGKTVS
jgi:hypothetical protein